jgi:hypothetical protein
MVEEAMVASKEKKRLPPEFGALLETGELPARPKSSMSSLAARPAIWTASASWRWPGCGAIRTPSR